MPVDITPSTVATNALQAIPFSSLIGGPLDACIQAQALAAKTTYEFIKQVGLWEDPVTKEKKTVNVVFQYQKNGRMVNLVVPLLMIVPIPYIAVNEVTIDFMAKISAESSSVSQTSETTSYGGEASIGGSVWGFKLDFKANYSSKKDSTATASSKYSVEYTMNVHVAAGQESMPAGLAAVLNLLQEGITTADPSGKLILTTKQVDLTTADMTGKGPVEASAENQEGLRQQKPITFELGTGTALKLEVLRGTPDSGSTETKKIITPDEKGMAGVNILIATAPANSKVETMTVTTNIPLGNRSDTKTDTVTINVIKAA